MKQFMIDWFKEAMFWTGCILTGYVLFRYLAEAVGLL